MLRTITFAALIAAGLAGVAGAAEPGQTLVNRSGAADVFAGRNNVVGGAARTADGSQAYLYQGGQHFDINAGYNQAPVASYQGNGG